MASTADYLDTSPAPAGGSMSVTELINSVGNAAGNVIGAFNKGPSATDLANAFNQNAAARAKSETNWTPLIIGLAGLAGVGLVLALIFRRSG